MSDSEASGSDAEIEPAVPYICPRINSCSPLSSYWTINARFNILTVGGAIVVGPLVLSRVARYIRRVMHQGNVFPTVIVTGTTSPYGLMIQFPYAIVAPRPFYCAPTVETPPPVPLPLPELKANCEAIIATATMNFAEGGAWNEGLKLAARKYLLENVETATVTNFRCPECAP